METKRSHEIRTFVIFLAIAALGWLIPPFGDLTPVGMKVLSVFLASLFGWSFSQRTWVSLTIVALLPMTGVMNMTSLLAASFGNSSWVSIIVAYAFVGLMMETGVGDYFVSLIFRPRFVREHPWITISAMFILTWLLSCMTSIFTGTILVWGLVYKLCDSIGCKPGDRLATTLVFGVLISGMLSTTATPWLPNVLVITGAFTSMTGLSINYINYMLFTIPFSVVSMLAFTLMARFLFRPDVTPIRNADFELLSAGAKKAPKKVRIALAGFGVFLLLLLVPNVLPAGNPVKSFLDNLGLVGAGFLVLSVLSLIRTEDGPLLSLHALFTKHLPWKMLIMTAGIQALCGALFADNTGLSEFLSAAVVPVFSSLPKVLFLLTIVLLGVVLTNFMINAIVAIALLAPALAACTALGITEYQVLYVIIISTSVALLTPPSGASAMLLHSNTEWIKPKEIWLYSIPTLILLSVILVCLSSILI